MNTTIPHSTYLKMVTGEEFTINGFVLKCLEIVDSPTNLGEHIDNYFIGISTLGVMLLVYQIITYLMYIYGWWSSSHHNIKVRLLPLQIYMRDLNRIIGKIHQKGGYRRTEHLRKLKEEYEEFIEADKYCWVKYKNPIYINQLKKHQPTYQKICWCCGKTPTPRFKYELCELDNSWSLDGSMPIGVPRVKRHHEKTFSKDVEKRWQKVALLSQNLASKKVKIKREIYKDGTFYYAFTYLLTLGYSCGKPAVQHAKSIEVDEKDIFRGRYMPYFVDPTMKTIDLNQNLFTERGNVPTRHKKVEGVDDSCARFFCGWWLGWTLQDMELALRTEFEEEHLKTDLSIEF